MRILCTALLTGLLCGCGEPEVAATASVRLGSAPQTGVYTGTFPCADCSGIAATLWLRPDGRFFSKRSYLDGEQISLDAYSLGHWRWQRDAGTVVLDGAGPDQVLKRIDSEHLELATHSPLPHIFSRQTAEHAFTESFEIHGTAELRDGTYIVTECATGLAAPLEQSGDFNSLRRQLRSVAPRGEASYVEFEGRFSWADTGAPDALHMDRLLRFRPGRGC